MQREIELNKASKRGVTSSLPDAKGNTGTSNVPKGSSKPPPPSWPPAPLSVATTYRPGSKLPDETLNEVPDKLSGNSAVPDATNKTNTRTTDDIKPVKGVFKTKTYQH